MKAGTVNRRQNNGEKWQEMARNGEKWQEMARHVYIQYGDCIGFHRFSHFRDGEPDSLQAGRDGFDLMVAQVALLPSPQTPLP